MGCAITLEEREAARFLLWSKRGALVGQIARQYCRSASPLEQQWMREASINHSGDAVVEIKCPE